MINKKIQKIINLIDSIKSDITIPLISDFLEWFYELLYIHFKKESANHKYKKGEIYFINLGKNIGSELNKNRPCMVYSIKSYNSKNGIIIIPLKSLKNKNIIEKFQIKLEKDKYNNLKKDSLIDIFYIRNISSKRINKYIGKINNEYLIKIDDKIIKMFGIKK